MPIITSMPSPRGTNDERLFILRGRKSTNPQGAYDAMPRLKTAADGERYARQRHARRGMAYDLELINELYDHVGAMDSRRKCAQDARPRSTGISEAARRSFEEMYGSHASTIKVL